MNKRNNGTRRKWWKSLWLKLGVFLCLTTCGSLYIGYCILSGTPGNHDLSGSAIVPVAPGEPISNTASVNRPCELLEPDAYSTGEWQFIDPPENTIDSTAILASKGYQYEMLKSTPAKRWICSDRNPSEAQRILKAASWHWRPDGCTMGDKLSVEELREVVRQLGPFILMGDSLTEQIFYSLVGRMIGKNRDALAGGTKLGFPPVLKELKTYLASYDDSFHKSLNQYSSFMEFYHPDGKLAIRYHRNDHLLLKAYMVEKEHPDPNIAAHIFDRCWDELTSGTNGQGIIIMNGGMHFNVMSEGHLGSLLERTSQWLNKFWKGNVLYTGILQPHGDCAHEQGPLHHEQATEDSYNWVKLPMYDRIARDTLRRFERFYYLNTSFIHLRPDGHMVTAPWDATKRDCVHYCMPGPIDELSDVLMSLLQRKMISEAGEP